MFNTKQINKIISSLGFIRDRSEDGCDGGYKGYYFKIKDTQDYIMLWKHAYVEDIYFITTYINLNGKEFNSEAYDKYVSKYFGSMSSQKLVSILDNLMEDCLNYRKVYN